MELTAIGRELRAQRTVAGRTVASVASDAGLSVPYIANLENGRGNPTVTALTRLAAALGLRLEVTLVPSERDTAPGQPATPDQDVPRGQNAPSRATAPPGLPASLVRLGRTPRFRDTMTASAAALNVDADDFGRQTVSALATLAQALGGDLTEADWWRLLDAVLLVATHPASGPPGGASLSRRQQAGHSPTRCGLYKVFAGSHLA
jgi:transcriptional regulator with XRE-family HTH domain